MARFTEAELEQLKNTISVERLVESAGIVLKRSGKDKIGLCPFHADGEPSLVITPAKNLWHCFSCQIGGNAIDWLMKLRGVSFRHAVELLKTDSSLGAGAGTGVAVTGAMGAVPIKHSTVRSLPAPIAFDADDQALLNQTVDYYHQSLLTAPEALSYLSSRGLDHPQLMHRFKLGYANRTLGLRLPFKQNATGEHIRSRLQKIGIYRESGHEHFNGSLIVPVIDMAGNVTEIYGRKIIDNLRKGTPKHLYLPEAHKGVWNESALAENTEIILCEALIDAMTFWCAGFRNVTASYGVEGFTDDHLAAFKRYETRRVLIAYDRDAAGDKAAQRLAEQLIGMGIDCYRIQFAQGMDANATALAGSSAERVLGMAIRKAHWLGRGDAPVRPVVVPTPDLAKTPSAKAGEKPTAPAPELPAPLVLPPSPLPALPASPQPLAALADVSVAEHAAADEDTRRFVFGERCYRVRGLSKNSSPEVLKINLLAACGERFHVDSLDLYAAKARASFVLQASLECRQSEEVLRADIGRILLQLEAVQDERLRRRLAPVPEQKIAISDEDRRAAMTLLKDPALIERIVGDMAAAGIMGEVTNKLVGYLAATSRKLANPLAIVIRSSSAAGKTSLMDAVLGMMPPEERIKYSAMTGQSLFYMGQVNLKHKILALAEEEGASRASYALKLLQSEGELTMASTGKDAATGNLITQEYRVEGPVMLFTTTTALDIDPELLNRCLVLTVDEGRQQTQAIHRHQRSRRTLQGLIVKQEKARLINLHQNAQRLLQPLAVMNPYAEQLSFPDNATRTRRDHEKYLTLMDTIALLHQHQRPIKTALHHDKNISYIEVTKEDIALANAIAHDVLGRSLDELPPQTRTLLRALCDMVGSTMRKDNLLRSQVRFSRRSAREFLGVGDTQLRLHVERLVEFEYLIARRDGPGGKFEYELAYDGDVNGDMQDDHQPHLPGLIQVEGLANTNASTSANTTTTANSRGQVHEGAGHSRGDSGLLAAGVRGVQNVAKPGGTGVTETLSDIAVEMHCSGQKNNWHPAS